MALINCSECGHQVSDKAKTCPNCGCPIETQLPPPIPEPAQAQQTDQAQQQTFPIGVFDNGPSGKSRGVTALLALFFGCLGVHYFYVGKIGAGVLFLVCSLVSCGFLAPIVSILCLVQTIRLFIMTHEEFEQTYVNSTTFLPI